MKQLNIFCEGPTEQGFCIQVLQPHLFAGGDGIVHTLAVGEKNHHHVFGLGGRSKYDRIRKFINNTIKQRNGKRVYFTTLFDLYGVPNDFPGKDCNVRNALNPTPYVMALEKAFGDDIDCHRFLPYLQLHEFETMLFADPKAFGFSFENCDKQILELNKIVASTPSIEHINDNRDSAPSKRIINLIGAYEGRKASAGPDIAEFIGLPVIRKKCPHVDQWLIKLENLDWTD